jgi:ankyrin repeat protein
MLSGYFGKQGRSVYTEIDNKGNNLLHSYLKELFCFSEMVCVLIDHGVNVNLINGKGDSPLSMYLQLFHLENKGKICQLLIQSGADLLWKNSLGENLAYVQMHSFVEDYQVLRILKHSGLNMFSKDHSNKSILHYAAIHCSLGEILIASLHDCSFLGLYQLDLDGLTLRLYAEKCACEWVEDENTHCKCPIQNSRNK